METSKMAESLAHTKYVCKYHIVFTPKYRCEIIYYQLRDDFLQTFYPFLPNMRYQA